MAACSTSTGGTSTGGGGTPSPTATAAPTKPTSVPTITIALCEQMLSISQANQILNPPNPANTIVVDSTSEGGSCNYEYAQFKIDVYLLFLPYKGGSSSDLAAAATSQSLPGVQITTNQPVSGIGDQALFIAGNAASNGLTAQAFIL
jgi:hypothetical protein